MIALAAALPDLVRDLESALIRIGRGKVADQLREVDLERWTYDETCDVAALHVRPREASVEPRVAAARPGEILALYDELGASVELDRHGRVTVIEIVEAGPTVARLRQARL